MKNVERLLVSALWACVVACGNGGPGTGSHASDYIDGTTGNSAAAGRQDGLNIKVIFNAAVLDARGGRFSDQWHTGNAGFDLGFQPATGSPLLDEGASYLYLFQIVNAADSGKDIGTFSLQLLVPPADVTSWGTFAQSGFKDDKGEVTAANAFGSNTYLHASVDDLTSMDPIAFLSGVSQPGVVQIHDGHAPADVAIGGGHFDATWATGSVLKPGDRSVIFGFTSDDAPVAGDGAIVPHCPGC